MLKVFVHFEKRRIFIDTSCKSIAALISSWATLLEKSVRKSSKVFTTEKFMNVGRTCTSARDLSMRKLHDLSS